jgi:hypothetical protein
MIVRTDFENTNARRGLQRGDIMIKCVRTIVSVTGFVFLFNAQMANATSWSTANVQYDDAKGKVTLSGQMAGEVLELLKDFNAGVDQGGFRKLFPSVCTVQPNGACAPLEPIASCKLDGTSCVLSSDFASADYISDLSACYQGVLQLNVDGYRVFSLIQAHPGKYQVIDAISGGSGSSEGSGSATTVLRIHNNGVLRLQRLHFEQLGGIPASAVAKCRQPVQFVD